MAYLEIIEGDNRGRTVRLGTEVLIGRTAENGLCLADTSVSRQHAAVRPKDNHFVIIDLGSANGTFVNKRALHRHVPQPLYEGDQVAIGPWLLSFHAEGQDPLGAKKKVAGITLAGHSGPFGGGAGLTMTFTPETHVPEVSATMDASLSMLLSHKGKQETASLKDAVRRLAAMVKVSQDLGTLSRPEALLEQIMSSIFDLFPHADRAFIMLVDPKTGKLSPAMGRNRDSTDTMHKEFAISSTIINTVVDKKQSILSSDAQRDGRFSSQSIVDLSIRSLMCAPFICKEELLGVISIDTRSSRHAFSAEDLAMLTSIAGQAAIAIKNAELYSTVEKETQMRTHLSRYLSPDVVEGVLDGSISLALGGERKHGTVFFCDIVGFTAMAESLEAMDVVELLNRYFTITTGIITRHNGTLHKFGGDMIMAFWNVMVKDDDAELNAIRASVEMQSAVWMFDQELAAIQRLPIFLGIGCNTGEFAGGNIGGLDRMEYTVIGDNVNLAQRIESLASRWQVFCTQQTYDPASHHCIAIKLPQATVKGKSLPVPVYSIRGVEIAEGSFLLSIPVKVADASGSKIQDGFLCNRDKRNSQMTLLLSVSSVPVIGSRITCTFDCPELEKVFSFTTEITECLSQQSEYPHCAQVLIKNIEGDDVLSFLCAGSLEVTTRAWADMPRH